MISRIIIIILFIGVPAIICFKLIKKKGVKELVAVKQPKQRGGFRKAIRVGETI